MPRGDLQLLAKAGVAHDELPGPDRDAVPQVGAGAAGIFVYHGERPRFPVPG